MIPLLLSDPYPAFLATFAGLVIALAIAVPAAFAADVTLWACHGPAGQPLGSGPFVRTAGGDGVASSYGAGCAAAAAAAGDGGLSATFSRADPQVGSRAGWRVGVPSGTTLDSVTLERVTSGFGGVSQPGDPLRYDASTSSGVLEATTVEDASDAPLAGTASFPVTGGEDVAFEVACGQTASPRCSPTNGVVGVEVSSLALVVSDDTPPRAAVGGISNPAAGVLTLGVTATDAGLGLQSATAIVDGRTVATAALGGPNCAALDPSGPALSLPLGAACPVAVNNVPLSVDTAGLADGPHQLTVTVTDAAGNTTTAVAQQLTVRNHLVVPGSSVLLAVGSGGQLPGTSAANGGKSQGGTRLVVCDSPQLSATLASRPLRISRDSRAVLWAGTRYLFTGRLTCVSEGRRIGAPTNTVVDIRSLVKRGHVPRTGAAVYAHGRFRVLLHPRTTRTIEFRVGAGKAVRQVSIHVLVTPNRTPS